MESKTSFSEGLLGLVHKCNSFLRPGSSRDRCLPFVVCGKKVGLIRHDFVEELRKFPAVFCIRESGESGVYLVPQNQTAVERTEQVAGVLAELRHKDVFCTLRAWRDEMFDVRSSFCETPVMKLERAATCLFGTIQYGVHLNAYTYTASGEMMMWLGRRTKTKPTYPGLLDNMCAGGLATGLGITECLIKECQEEASVDSSYLKNVTSAGTISYFFEDERGLFPECQFVYDLVLPTDFKPVNADGEVASFELVSMTQLKKLMITEDFKLNCALVILEFMIRHGVITPDEEPNYAYFVEQMHVPLQTFFSNNV